MYAEHLAKDQDIEIHNNAIAKTQRLMHDVQRRTQLPEGITNNVWEIDAFEFNIANRVRFFRIAKSAMLSRT